MKASPSNPNGHPKRKSKANGVYGNNYHGSVNQSHEYNGPIRGGIVGGHGNVNQIFNETGSSAGKKGVDLLLHYCALEALVSSLDRHDADSPGCSKGSRDEVIEEIVEWFKSDEPSASMMWIYGSAGVGKSALLHTVAETMQQEGRLLGSFFFSRTSTISLRRNGDCLIPTLAYELLQQIPSTRRVIEDYLDKDPGIFLQARQFQVLNLFTQPLNSLLPPPVRKSGFRRLLKSLRGKRSPSTSVSGFKPLCQLIVIDGIDQCEDFGIQKDLLKMMAHTVTELRIPIRFLISSRPESHIRRTIDHESCFQRIKLRRMDLDQDPRAQMGIQKFLFEEFSNIRRTHPLTHVLDASWPSKDAITTLISKSSWMSSSLENPRSFSQFIYAATVIKYLQSPGHRPDTRLQVILKISPRPQNDRPLAQLDALYSYIFSCIEEDRRDLVWRILGILHLTLTGKVHQVDSPLIPSVLEKILGLMPGDIHLLLGPLAAVISCPTSQHEDICVLHASLFDYLLDDARSEEFTLDLGYAHDSLAKYFYRQSSADFKDVERQHILQFLKHCKHACLSEELQESLLAIPPILAGMYLGAYRADVPLVALDCLVDIFLREDFIDGKQQLADCLETLGSKMIGQTPQPNGRGPFNSNILNISHQIYTSFINDCIEIELPDDPEPDPQFRPYPIIPHIHPPSSRLQRHLLVILGAEPKVLTIKLNWLRRIIDSSRNYPQTTRDAEVDDELNQAYTRLQQEYNARNRQ